MSTNNRIFYATQALGFSKLGENNFTECHGLQSVGANTRFNLEQVFELGQISIYDNIEALPDVELTTSRVFDGYPPAYLLATNGATSASLAGRSNVRTSAALNIYSDAQDSASGSPISSVVFSGLYISQLNYNFPVDGNFTEELTLVGNNKAWVTGSQWTFTPTFDDADQPMSLSGSGGTQRRQHMLMGSAGSLWPTDIPGVSSSGTNEAQSGGAYSAHIQTVRVSTNLGRDQLFEQGNRGPYFRFVNFPTEVRTDIEVTSSSGDNLDADETATSNVSNQTIKIKLEEGTILDLGTKNKCNSVTYTGGNAGQNGGNVTQQYSYVNFNDLTVTHPADPTTALRP